MRAFLAGVMCALLLSSCAPPARRLAAPDLPQEVSATSTQADANKLLKDVARAALGAGAHELVVLGYGAASPGDRVEAMVHIPKAACALFVSRGTTTVEDLDLHIYGDDGSQHGVDESPDALPTLLLCPEIDVRLFASARVAQGDGLVALGVHTVARGDAQAVAQAVGARNFAMGVVPLEEPWPGLLDALQKRRASLGGTWLDQRRVALPLDSRVPTHLTVDVPAGRCLDALVLPDPETSGLQLTVLDDKGRIFARGDALGQRQATLLCSNQTDTSLTIELRPYAGRGVAVAAFSVSTGAVSSLDLSPDVGLSLVDEGQASEDYARLSAPLWKKQWQLERGQIVSAQTTLKGCHRIDLTPDKQLLDYQALVWNSGGELLAETESRRGVPLFVCVDGPIRIDLLAQGRSGELTLELRKGEQPAEVLQDNPLAASRLLSRAHSTGHLLAPEDIGRVTAIDISSTKLGRVSLSLPALHCQTLLVAGGHGAFGLEGRVLDLENGLEIDRSVGRTALQLRACAPPGGDLKAVLEVRATSGATRALWSSRQERLP